MAPEGRLGILDSLQKAIIDAGKGKIAGTPRAVAAALVGKGAEEERPSAHQPSRRFTSLRPANYLKHHADFAK